MVVQFEEARLLGHGRWGKNSALSVPSPQCSFAIGICSPGSAHRPSHLSGLREIEWRLPPRGRFRFKHPDQVCCVPVV